MKCPHCGGLMVIECIGNYGNVYPLKKNGDPGKKRIRRIIYEEDGMEDTMIYCWDCKRMKEDRT
jgi:hypothetical protein